DGRGFDQTCRIPVGQDRVARTKRRRYIARDGGNDQLKSGCVEEVRAEHYRGTPLAAGRAAEGDLHENHVAAARGGHTRRPRRCPTPPLERDAKRSTSYEVLAIRSPAP